MNSKYERVVVVRLLEEKCSLTLDSLTTLLCLVCAKWPHELHSMYTIPIGISLPYVLQQMASRKCVRASRLTGDSNVLLKCINNIWSC